MKLIFKLRGGRAENTNVWERSCVHSVTKVWGNSTRKVKGTELGAGIFYAARKPLNKPVHKRKAQRWGGARQGIGTRPIDARGKGIHERCAGKVALSTN